MTSVLNVDEIAAKDGTSPVELTKQSAAKAWVHIDGTGTVTIDGSFNVASVTDSGTGTYAPSFTNSMSDSSYSPTMLTEIPSNAADNAYRVFSMATGSYSLQYYQGGTQADVDPCTSNVCGDLA